LFSSPVLLFLKKVRIFSLTFCIFLHPRETGTPDLIHRGHERSKAEYMYTIQQEYWFEGGTSYWRLYNLKTIRYRDHGSADPALAMSTLS